MIILDGAGEILQAVLAGAISSDQPEFQVSFGRLLAVDLETYDANHGELNSTTDVALLTGLASKQLLIKSIDIFNKDDAPVTVTIKKDVSGTDRFLYLAVLESSESVHYVDGRGWYVCDAEGAEKTSGGAGGAADGFNRISAGTQIAGTNTTVLFSNANGVSFGMSGSSRITASHDGLTSQSNQAFSADASSTFQTLSFQDSNGVSFSNNAGALRVTHALQFTSATSGITSAALHTSAALRAIYDGANSISTGTIRFTNANGVSFSVNGQTISGSVAAQTNQSVGLYGVGNTTQNSSTTLDARTLSFGGRGDITVGFSNGTVQISGSQTVQTQSLIAAVYDGANSISTGTVRFTNANGVSFSINGQTISGSVTPETPFGVSAGTQSVSTGTLVFSNSNNVTFGMSGSSRVTASASFPAETPFGVSAGTQSVSTGTLVFSNSNGITFGMSGSSRVTASHDGITSQSNQNVTAGNGGFAFQTLSFSDLNGFSFGTSAGSAITGSYTRPVVSNAIQSVGSATGSGTNTSRFAADDHVHAGVFSMGVSNDAGNTVGDTRVDVGRFVLRGGNNITLSQITAANALNTVVFSAGAGGGGAAISAAGNSVSDGTIVFSNSNNVSFGMAGSTITATITVPAQTNQTVGMYATGNTTQNSSTTFDARTLGTVNATGGVTVGFSNGSIQVSGPFSATTISGVTSANAIGTRGSRFALEDHQHEGVYQGGMSTAGNTAGNTFLRPGRIAFQGSNAITLSGETAANSLQTIHIQGPVSATTISGVTSANVIGTRGSRFALEDHQHEGVYAVGFSTNGNTAGDTALRPGRLVLVGGNNITLSGATAANSLQTITISGPNQSNQQMTLFATGNTTQSSTGTTNASSMIFRGSGAASVGITNGSVLIDVAAGAAAITQSIGMSTQTAGGATAGTTGYATGDDILYHLVPGSNITMSQSIDGASGTLSIYGPAAGGVTMSAWNPYDPAAVWMVTAQANGSLWIVPKDVVQPFQYDRIVMPLHFSQATNSTLTVSNTIAWGWYTVNGNTLSLYKSGSGTFSINGSGTASSAQNSGIRAVSMASTDTITAGNYYLGVVWRSTTAGADASLSYLALTQFASTKSGYLGLASNTRMIIGPGGGGVWTSTTAGPVPNSVGRSDIRGNQSNQFRQPIVYFTSGEITY